jgi:CubicO group peptidase (beta-lactamase class C family)
MLATTAVGASLAGAQPARGQQRSSGVTHCTMTRKGGYQKADPSDVGLDAGKLQKALNYASLMGSDTIKVYRYGCLAGHGLRDAVFNNIPTDTWGQAKTVTALLTGIAADKGWVDIDKPIGTYLPKGLGDKAHRAVTLRALMTATSGAQVQQVRGLNFFADTSRARGWLRQPMVHKPGTYYEYDQVAPSMVIFVLQRVIHQHHPGLDFQDWAQQVLFDPIGIPKSSYFWQRDRAGTTTGYSQLWMRPTEFGRLGQMMMQSGSFDGQQVVPASFMRELRTGTKANCGYGFYTWVNSCQPGEHQVNMNVPERITDYGGVPWIESAPSDMFFTDGIGIHTWVIPSLHMVVTRSGVQEMNLVPAATQGRVDALVPGAPDGPGVHQFFRLLMDAVTNMPQQARSTIKNSGPYDRARHAGADLTQFVFPLSQAPGSALALGPGAPVQCNPLGCKDAPNDGYLRYLTDIPRTIPGVLGADHH